VILSYIYQRTLRTSQILPLLLASLVGVILRSILLAERVMDLPSMYTSECFVIYHLLQTLGFYWLYKSLAKALGFTFATTKRKPIGIA